MSGWRWMRLSLAVELEREMMMNEPFRGSAVKKARAGQALVEFAIISFVLTAMLAGFLGIIVLGLGSFQNNIAAESAGRLLDEHPALIKENFVKHFADDATDPFNFTTQGMGDLTARQIYRFLNEYEIDRNEFAGDGTVLYDERLLILSREAYHAKIDPRTDLPLPEINQALLGQYIFDPDLEVVGQVDQGSYRFPGAVVERTTAEGETYQTVLIPLLDDTVKGQSIAGVDRTFSITLTNLADAYPVARNWVAPVTVVKDRFSDAISFKLVFFHPSQPASMINLEVVRDEDNQIISQGPEELGAGTTHSEFDTLPSGYQFASLTVNPDYDASASRGGYGLGETFAFATTVRPFRAVFESSSLFRLTNAPIVVNTAYIDPPQTGEDDRPPLRALTSVPLVIQYSAAGSPILLKDRSEVIPTSDIAVDPPFDRAAGAYETVDSDNEPLGDQSLNFESPVIFNSRMPRYFVDFPVSPPASADNDFAQNVFRLLPDDDGVWRVSASVELEGDIQDLPAPNNPFVNPPEPPLAPHHIELRLYHNGIFRSVIAQSTKPLDTGSPKVLVKGDAILRCVAGDILQVRIFTDLPPNQTYDVHLTGEPAKNWVSFERIGG